jgi:hypothetical protein
VPQRHRVIDTSKRCTTNILQYGMFCYEQAIEMSRARHLSAVHKHGIATASLPPYSMCATASRSFAVTTKQEFYNISSFCVLP